MEREKFINEFIETTFNKVSKFLPDKEIYIDNSTELYNLGILICNTLKKYNIKVDNPELLVYDDPFSVRLIINLPISIIDVSFSLDYYNMISYQVEFINLEYNIKKSIKARTCELITKYIIGYLSAITLYDEVFKKSKEMDKIKYSEKEVNPS